MERRSAREGPDQSGAVKSVTADFFRRSLAQFPTNEIDQAEHYTSLLLDMNKLTALKETDLGLACFNELRVISIAFNQLTNLPSNIGRLEHLEQLACNGNKLKELDESLSSCKRLQYINAVGNQLTSLPASFRSLKSITRLILCENNFVAFPEAILDMINLEMLDLSGNSALRTLPETLGTLTSLRKFRVSNTGITTLPKCLPKLSSLKDFDASQNELSAVPDNIDQCPALKHLDLSYNAFEEVPEILYKIGLDSIQFQGNPLTSANTYIIDKKLIKFPQTLSSPPDLIIPGLYLGGIQASYHKYFLQQNNVVSIIAVIPDLKLPYEHLFKYLNIPEEDFYEADLYKYFETAITYIDENLRNGAVLVHCRAGVSRSATITLAYVMMKMKLTLQEALGYVIRRRSVVHPNFGFINQLHRWEQKLRSDKILGPVKLASTAVGPFPPDERDGLVSRAKSEEMASAILEEAAYTTRLLNNALEAENNSQAELPPTNNCTII